MSTPQLDALAREWAASHGLDLSPHRDAHEPLGATHAQALITEHWEKLTDPQHHYGLEPGCDQFHEYIDFVRGIQQSWHEHIERALTNARDDPKINTPLIAYSPNGHRITGTIEQLIAVARAASVTRDAPEALTEVSYRGSTEVEWDSQRTMTDPVRGDLFVCEDGREWWEDELVWRPANHTHDDELETS